MEDAVFRFQETKKDDRNMAATIFFGNMSIYIHIKMEIEEFVA